MLFYRIYSYARIHSPIPVFFRTKTAPYSLCRLATRPCICPAEETLPSTRFQETQSWIEIVIDELKEDYFYSKDRAALSEQYFGKVESIYGSLMTRLGRGEQLSQEALFSFFLCSVDFYARGCKFRVKDEQEEYEFYQKRIDIFKKQLLGNTPGASDANII